MFLSNRMCGLNSLIAGLCFSPALPATDAAPAEATTAPAVEAPAKKAATKKATAKKAAAKKAAPAKKAKKATEATVAGEFGVERSHDLPWCEKKVNLFKGLKKAGAVGATTAKSAADIAAKAGITARDVRHYAYHAKASGLVGVAAVEGQRGYGFYLTAKGAGIDPVAAFKAQEKGDA